MAVIGSVALVVTGLVPLPAGAQRAGVPYRIGVLNDARAANHPAADGLKAGLKEAGLQEGKDVIFDVRLTYGSSDRMLAAAAAVVVSVAALILPSTRPEIVARPAAASS